MSSKCLRSIIRLELITQGRAASACWHTCVLPQAAQKSAAWCLPQLASWHGFGASAASPGAAKCWQCGQLIAGSHAFFCPKCRSLQAPPPQPDYFAIMGMDTPDFDVDTAQLEQRYKGAQRELHPDKFGQRSSREQQYSADHSAQVNLAYNTLRSPLSRAVYMLQQQGVAEVDSEGTISDPAYLMDIMELREQIDSTADEAELKQLLAENQAKQRDAVQAISGAFKALDLNAALQRVVEMRYLKRIDDAISDKSQ